MADAVAVRTQVMTAAEFMAEEASAAYRALFNWLGSRVSTLFIDDVATLGGVTAIAAGATRLLAVEALGGTTGTGANIQLFDAATGGVTLGTTIPLLLLNIPVNVRRVWTLFTFESSQYGMPFATALSAAATTNATFGTASATTNRPQLRTITTAD